MPEILEPVSEPKKPEAETKIGEKPNILEKYENKPEFQEFLKLGKEAPELLENSASEFDDKFIRNYLDLYKNDPELAKNVFQTTKEIWNNINSGKELFKEVSGLTKSKERLDNGFARSFLFANELLIKEFSQLNEVKERGKRLKQLDGLIRGQKDLLLASSLINKLNNNELFFKESDEEFDEKGVWRYFFKDEGQNEISVIIRPLDTTRKEEIPRYLRGEASIRFKINKDISIRLDRENYDKKGVGSIENPKFNIAADISSKHLTGFRDLLTHMRGHLPEELIDKDNFKEAAGTFQKQMALKKDLMKTPASKGYIKEELGKKFSLKE